MKEVWVPTSRMDGRAAPGTPDSSPSLLLYRLVALTPSRHLCRTQVLCKRAPEGSAAWPQLTFPSYLSPHLTVKPPLAILECSLLPKLTLYFLTTGLGAMRLTQGHPQVQRLKAHSGDCRKNTKGAPGSLSCISALPSATPAAVGKRYLLLSRPDVLIRE